MNVTYSRTVRVQRCDQMEKWEFETHEHNTRIKEDVGGEENGRGRVRHCSMETQTRIRSIGWYTCRRVKKAARFSSEWV